MYLIFVMEMKYSYVDCEVVKKFSRVQLSFLIKRLNRKIYMNRSTEINKREKETWKCSSWAEQESFWIICMKIGIEEEHGLLSIQSALWK